MHLYGHSWQRPAEQQRDGVGKVPRASERGCQNDRYSSAVPAARRRAGHRSIEPSRMRAALALAALLVVAPALAGRSTGDLALTKDLVLVLKDLSFTVTD